MKKRSLVTFLALIALGSTMGVIFTDLMGYTSFGLFTLTPTGIQASGLLNIQGLEVYWDTDKTLPVTEIDWGSLDVGSTNTRTIYVFNTGTVDLQLTSWYTDLDTLEYKYLSVYDDLYQSSTLVSGAYTSIVCTIDVDSNSTAMLADNFTSFSYIMNIQGAP